MVCPRNSIVALKGVKSFFLLSCQRSTTEASCPPPPPPTPWRAFYLGAEGDDGWAERRALHQVLKLQVDPFEPDTGRRNNKQVRERTHPLLTTSQHELDTTNSGSHFALASQREVLGTVLLLPSLSWRCAGVPGKTKEQTEEIKLAG